jgi:hypothetical protein
MTPRTSPKASASSDGVAIAGTWPGVEVSMSYRTPALTVGGRWFARIQVRRQPGIRDAGVAVWDECKSAGCQGSAEAAMQPASVGANAFGPLPLTHEGIARICFNGQKALALFERHVVPVPSPVRAAHRRTIESRVLPSSSAAHASVTRGDKAAIWNTARSPAVLSAVRPPLAAVPLVPIR